MNLKFTFEQHVDQFARIFVDPNNSDLAQRQRAGPITLRSEDRNFESLHFLPPAVGPQRG